MDEMEEMKKMKGEQGMEGRENVAEERFQEYLRKAEQGDAEAQYQCGIMYDGMIEGMPMDAEAAFGWYRKAAEQGHMSAQFCCGLMCISGEGTAENKEEGLHWFLKAAKQETRMRRFDALSCMRREKELSRTRKRLCTGTE